LFRTQSNMNMESPKPDSHLSTIRPSMPALMIVLLAGAILGVAPFAFFLKSGLFFSVYIAIVIVITLIGIFRVKIESTATPTIGEYALAALGILCFHTIAGLTGSVFYIILLWGTRLVQLAASWIGWEVHSNPYAIAKWPSVILSILFGGVYAFESFKSVRRTLFPAKAGIRSMYYVMLHGRRVDIHMFYYPVVALLFCTIIVLIFRGHRSAFVFASQLFLLFVSLLPMLMLQSSRGLPLKREVVLAMIKLASVLGYKVIESPHTKDPEIDPMLVGVDLLLSKGQHAWLVDIKTSLRTAEPVQAWDASTLPLAARALSKFVSRGESSPITVTPVLVLIGRSPSDSLRELAKDVNLRLVTFDDMTTVLEILKIDDENTLREVATRFLGREFTSGDALNREGAV